MLGRTGAPCRDCSRWVSPARPPHPELATGPVPPEAGQAIADPDLPGIWHLRTPRTAVIAGVYDDEVRVWIVRPHT